MNETSIARIIFFQDIVYLIKLISAWFNVTSLELLVFKSLNVLDCSYIFVIKSIDNTIEYYNYYSVRNLSEFLTKKFRNTRIIFIEIIGLKIQNVLEWNYIFLIELIDDVLDWKITLLPETWWSLYLKEFLYLPYTEQ